jgi:hypothetical protein
MRRRFDSAEKPAIAAEGDKLRCNFNGGHWAIGYQREQRPDSVLVHVHERAPKAE